MNISPPALWACSVWESADSIIPVPLYEKNHLFLLKILKLFVFRQFYYMSWRRTFWIEILRWPLSYIRSPNLSPGLKFSAIISLKAFFIFTLLLSFEIPVVHTQSIWCPILNSHRFLHFFSPQVGSFQTLLACWFSLLHVQDCCWSFLLISSVQSLYSSSPKFLLGSFMFSLWTAVLFLYCNSDVQVVCLCSLAALQAYEQLISFDLHFFVVSY